MEQDAESYDFPGRIIRTLEFNRVFEKCVGAMRPILIVSLGRLAARHLGTDYARRETVERRTIGNHPTKLMVTVHPSAWTWQKRGFTERGFRLEGERIGSAYRDQQGVAQQWNTFRRVSCSARRNDRAEIVDETETTENDLTEAPRSAFSSSG